MKKILSRKHTASTKKRDNASVKKVTLKEHTKKPVSTSWGDVATWYDTHLEKNEDTYHAKVIFPNVLRLLGDITNKKVLDLCCGQGIFSREMHKRGAYVTGIDIGKELIALAEKEVVTNAKNIVHKISYHVASADDLYMLKSSSFDAVICILAIQNVEHMQKAVEEVSRVLVSGGTCIFVLNHPSFRNPKQTHWAYDIEKGVQYRRVDEYMSESRIRIDMTPGSDTDKKFTVSFHRPLQVYVKALGKHSLAITSLEEWVSHKSSEKGPYKELEDKARKEIPLFMCLVAKKIV